jgi:hypothetical protein
MVRGHLLSVRLSEGVEPYRIVQIEDWMADESYTELPVQSLPACEEISRLTMQILGCIRTVSPKRESSSTYDYPVHW